MRINVKVGNHSVYHTDGDENMSSDSDDDDAPSRSKWTESKWTEIVKTAEAAKQTFNLYLWTDDPKSLSGHEASGRVHFLSTHSGYPFNNFFPYDPVGKCAKINDADAIQLLYLCHKIKHGLPYNKVHFIKQSGDVEELRSAVWREKIANCILL
jgi:hypothetical protein